MAHYAFLDENNIVTEVIPGKDENELIEGLDPVVWYGNYRNQICKRTSYSGSMRKNFAGVGYKYDSIRDAFIPLKPWPSWVLDEATCQWGSPTAYPIDGKMYSWDETTLSWKVIA